MSRVKTANAFFATVLLSLAAASVSAQTGDGWLSLHSKNFTIAGNASEPELRAATKRLEDFRWAFGRLYPQLKLDNDRPTTVVVFRDAAAYESFLPRRPDGSTDEGVAGYFLAGEDTNYVTLAARAGKSDPLGTVVHEYVHLVLASNFSDVKVPPWLAEGLAEYFETARIENGQTVVLGGELPEHLRLLRRTGLITPAELFAVDGPVLRSMAADRRRQFYAESWLAVHCLMSTGRMSVTDLAQTLSKLSEKSTSVGGAFSFDTAGFETELAGKIRQATLPVVTKKLDVGLPADEPLDVVALDSARSDAILGDLLFHSGEFARAETLLQQAVAHDKRDELANSALGQLLIRQEKPAEAKSYLKAAIDAGSTNHLVYFNYAYAISREFMTDGGLSSISEDAATAIRGALKRVIDLQPSYADAYRLLAIVDYVRDEDLDDAAAAIRQGLKLNPSDADLKLLLARIYLRRDDAMAARMIAEQVSKGSDPRYKPDADEIVKAAYDYANAKSAAQTSNQLALSVSRNQGLAVLKRSWLTDAEFAQIDAERITNNLNRLIIRPVTGELQIVGRIEQINCKGPEIEYIVNDAKRRLALRSTDFAAVKMTVAQEGERSFSIGCGARLSNELTVINYRPVPAVSGIVGQVSAISFVPDGFQLKSISEMMAARLVAIDDDTLRHFGPPAAVNAESRRRSILASLRKPKKDEVRAVGRINAIECSGDKTIFQVAIGDRILRLAASARSEPSIGWFTVASTQLLLACGSGPVSGGAVITYAPAANDSVGEIRAIEFVPEDFVLPQ